MPQNDAQFDGQNAVAGYTLFRAKDGQSYYLKGENLADDEIIKRVATLRANAPNTVTQSLKKATAVSPQPKPFTKEWFKQGLWRAAAGTAEAAPAAGATIGGLIGSTVGPEGAVGGAGFGGMGGEAAKELIERQLGFPDVPQSSGEAAQRITREGITQGLIQGGTELLPGAGRSLSKAAETQYERALAPTTKMNKFITKEITPELIKRGERGSLEGLESKATANIARLTPPLEQQYTGQMVTNAGWKVWSDLETLRQSYMPGGIVAQPQAVRAIEGVQDIIQQYGVDISDTNLRRLRQIFEEAPAQKGAYAGADLSTAYALNAQRNAADSIREILNSDPAIGALNKEISFWLDVQRVTRESALRKTGQAGGLVRVLGPVAAGAAASATGFKFGAIHGAEAGIGTALSVAAIQIIRSPAWRTTSAVVKNRLANYIAQGDVRAVTALAVRLGVAKAESRGGPPAPPSP